MNPRLHELFYYDDGKLFWRVDRGRVRAHSEAGCIAVGNRKYVQVDGKRHLVHRIIWFLHHGNCPEFLDHIDNNSLNNRIENLRPASKSQNAMNRKVRADSSTGVKGIIPVGNRFGAAICLNGVRNYLGTFDSADLAHAAYAEAAQKHFKEFARV